MIKIENVSFAYSDKSPLFENLSFSIERGQILAVMGSNGIGKTTLIKCIMGFLGFQKGKVFIGEDEKTSGFSDSLFWSKVGYVPQAKKNVFGYKVREMVVMGRNAFVGFGRTPSKADYACADEALDRLGIAALRDKSCNQLSGGQLQMVLIARALVKNPDILIMDEPESNLDMRNQMRVLDTVEKLAHEDKKAVLFNTHFPANALKISDKALFMGVKKYLFGDSAAIITEKNIRDFFHIDCSILDVPFANGSVRGIVPLAAI